MSGAPGHGLRNSSGSTTAGFPGVRPPGVRPDVTRRLARMQARTGYIAEGGHISAWVVRTGWPFSSPTMADPNWMPGSARWVPPSLQISAELFIKVVIALLATPERDEPARSLLAAQRVQPPWRQNAGKLTKMSRRPPVRRSPNWLRPTTCFNHLDADLRWMATHARPGHGTCARGG